MRTGALLPACAALISALSATACLSFGALAGEGSEPLSLGTASRGLLTGAAEIPAEGAHHRCYRRGGMRFGLPQLVGLVERAAARVAASRGGSVLYVGEMSAKWGGDEPGHSSHESGRDVDLAFFTATPEGNRLDGRPGARFDRFGVGLAPGGGEALLFDVERNWLLVEALLADEEADVQWIFASEGTKALLLRYALDHGRDRVVVAKAAAVLHQPSDSAPHDDHFHVRIYCPRGSAGVCVDQGPVWPWISEKRAAEAPPGFSDEELASMALELPWAPRIRFPLSRRRQRERGNREQSVEAEGVRASTGARDRAARTRTSVEKERVFEMAHVLTSHRGRNHHAN